MGFDTDIFIKQPMDENLMCVICHALQEKPKGFASMDTRFVPTAMIRGSKNPLIAQLVIGLFLAEYPI